MSLLHRLPPRRQIVVNYIGGLGYYALHFGWILLLFLLLLMSMQYLVLQGEPVLYTPAQTVPSASTEMQLPGIASLAITGLAGVGTLVFVTLLPYWIGYMSRRLPRWILEQTSWHVTNSNLHKVKQALSVSLLLLGVALLYQPGAAAAVNTGFFIVASSSFAAIIGFAVQYKLTALWHIPERHVY